MKQDSAFGIRRLGFRVSNAVSVSSVPACSFVRLGLSRAQKKRRLSSALVNFNFVSVLMALASGCLC